MDNLKEKVNARSVVFGTMLSEIATPNVVRIMQIAGFEFIIVDCEHGYFDFSQAAQIIAVGNGFGMPILIRIPTIEREAIIKVLDMGADGLLVPMVNSEQDAWQVVNYAKYAPTGNRGISTTRAHTNYNPPPLTEYIKSANAQTIVLVQLETREAIRNARKIASVDGVDGLMIGPNDLAMDMGAPGQFETAEMDDAITSVIAAAREAGKSSGIIASSVPFLHKCMQKGMNVFSCNSEVGMMIKAAKGIVKDLRAK